MVCVEVKHRIQDRHLGYRQIIKYFKEKLYTEH